MSGEHVSWQLKVLEGVEGNVSVVHDGVNDGNVSALKGQLLDDAEVRNRTIETGKKGDSVDWEEKGETSFRKCINCVMNIFSDVY